jgi:hypothetical protein
MMNIDYFYKCMFHNMSQPEELEGEADQEVDKIMQELTAGILGNTAAPTGKINGKMTAAQQVCISRTKFFLTFFLISVCLRVRFEANFCSNWNRESKNSFVASIFTFF